MLGFAIFLMYLLIQTMRNETLQNRSALIIIIIVASGVFLLFGLLMFKLILSRMGTTIALYEKGIKGKHKGKAFELLYEEMTNVHIFGDLSLNMTYNGVQVSMPAVWFQNKQQQWIQFPYFYKREMAQLFIDSYQRLVGTVKLNELKQGNTLSFPYNEKLKPKKKSFANYQLPSTIQLAQTTFSVDGKAYAIRQIRKVKVTNKTKISFNDGTKLNLAHGGMNHGVVFTDLLKVLIREN